MNENKMFKVWWKVLRPSHWVKSGFCLAALFFSGHFFDLASWLQVIPLLIGFSAMASAGYLFNDVVNRREDAMHPRKKFRPIASGELKVPGALVVSGALAIGAVILLFFCYGLQGLQKNVMTGAVLYLIQTASYSILFRRIPILDVVVLGVGFVLRVATGAYALNLEPTLWLLGCTYGIALLLGFGKRLGEWRLLEKKGKALGGTRSALRGYNENLLRFLIGLISFSVGSLYAGYCYFQTARGVFILSVIPVIVGLLTYLRMAWRTEEVESPERLLWKNPLLYGSIGIWLCLILIGGLK